MLSNIQKRGPKFKIKNILEFYGIQHSKTRLKIFNKNYTKIYIEYMNSI
jgi:hypothetical protein